MSRAQLTDRYVADRAHVDQEESDDGGIKFVKPREDEAAHSKVSQKKLPAKTRAKIKAASRFSAKEIEGLVGFERRV